MKRTNTAKWEDKYKRWKINVQKDGLRRSFYSSTPGRNGQREANKKADMWLDDNIVDQTVKVSTLFDEYVESLKLTTSKSNYSKIEWFGRSWIKPVIGNRKMSTITESDLQKIIDTAFASSLKSKKSLMALRATISSFYKFCRKKKITTMIPEDITIPKSAKIAQKRILQPIDLQKLFQSDMTTIRGKTFPDPYINAYRFQILTGLRPGELMGLQWSDIQNGCVYVQRSINRYGELTSGKNENAIRHFVLSKHAQNVLDDQKKYTQEGSVFKLESLEFYRRHWKYFCTANDIPYMSLYEMRHTFVSIVKNLSEGQIKPIVGHSKNMDTFGTYGHEVAGELQETAEEINHLFDRILK